MENVNEYDKRNGNEIMNKKIHNIPKLGDYCGIYCIYNSKYFYVGQSIHVNRRLKDHFKKLKLQKHENIIVQRVYNKHYKDDPLIGKGICQCDPNDLNYFEKYCFNQIKYKNPDKTSMNIMECGLSGDNLLSRINKSKAQKNKHYSKEHYKNISKLQTGVERPEKRIPLVQLDLDGNLIKIWYGGATEVYKTLNLKITPSRKSSHGFQWKKLSEYNQNGDNKIQYNTNKKIYQFSLDGKFIKEYNSIQEAVNFTNIKHCNISAAATGITKSAGNYLWSFTKIPPKYKKLTQHKKCNIVKYDENNNYLQTYTTIKDAAKSIDVSLNTFRRHVIDIINNGNEFVLYKNYIWKKN